MFEECLIFVYTTQLVVFYVYDQSSKYTDLSMYCESYYSDHSAKFA